MLEDMPVNAKEIPMEHSIRYSERVELQKVPGGIARLVAVVLLVVVALAVVGDTAQAQYFGRNKVHYRKFDFHVMQTEHFNIYFYPEEETAVRDAARMAERWYERLSGLFHHDLRTKKPIILYATQGDFQQTNAISGSIGEGTGGVTESVKNRVILPLTGSYAENDHVLGHELVHAFQYDIAGSFGRDGQTGMAGLPLWFIEGMAEYLSVGREDPNTAMWLRDVVLRDDIPTIDDLAGNPRYFPYRFGQALWAYIGGRFGDDKIAYLYGRGLKEGLDAALKGVLGVDGDSLSAQWAADLRATYGSAVSARTAPQNVGKPLLAENEDLNVAPSISPDGKYVAFLSSRGLFSIDLYLADASTGEVLKKLFSAESDGHFDAIRFVNSAGSWSPDGRKFAFVTFAEGSDEISVLDVASRSIERRIRMNGVRGISNPAWSPDGTRIAFSGISGGVSDIYVVDVRTSKTQKLTDDLYADFQPTWSPDGSTIAFASDRGSSTDFKRLVYAPLEISLVDVVGGSVRQLSLFPEANDINPQYSPDGRSLYFISNHGGVSDIYRYDLAGGTISRVTNIATGVSGIAATSPAMSVAAQTGRIVFSVFENGSNSIHAINPGEVPEETVTDRTGGVGTGGELPPRSPIDPRLVSKYLADAAGGLPIDPDYKVVPYSASLQLDYLGAPSIGISSTPGIGTSLGGSIAAYFSDLLGNHEVGVAVQTSSLSASLTEIGVDAYYLNQENRWNWGVTASHIPYIATQISTRPVDIEIDSQAVTAVEVRQDVQSVTVNGGSLLALYPFSTTQRFEAEAGYTHYGYSIESDYRYYVGGTEVASTTKTGDAPDGLNLFIGSTALVGDNSHFAFTSPVDGTRYRLEAGVTAGSLTFGTALADFRHYFFWNPVTLAVRALHYGRYGGDAESDRISPLFLGYPNYVRGYESSSFDLSECSNGGVDGTCPEFDRLLGSRMAVGNLEFRVPVFGTSQLGLINFPYLPLELGAFLDAGVAWTATEAPSFRFDRNTSDRVPVFSTGLTARANLLGYLVLEVYYAYPFQRPEKGAHFGFQIAPGW